MFQQNKCLVPYCRNNALTTFENDHTFSETRGYCLDHIPDPGKAKQDIYKYINDHEIIVGLNASGIIFSNINFSNKKFFGCNFTNCTFSTIHSENVTLKMCIFDFAVFNDCTLLRNNTIFSSFSGCTFSHTLFTSSEMIQTNFNGIKAYQSSFDDSDLFNSRFIASTLVDTSFRNCNLKKVLFYNTTRQNVSFKMSNTREALFEVEGSSLVTGNKIDYGNSIVDGGAK